MSCWCVVSDGPAARLWLVVHCTPATACLHSAAKSPDSAIKGVVLSKALAYCDGLDMQHDICCQILADIVAGAEPPGSAGDMCVPTACCPCPMHRTSRTARATPPNRRAAAERARCPARPQPAAQQPRGCAPAPCCTCWPARDKPALARRPARQEHGKCWRAGQVVPLNRAYTTWLTCPVPVSVSAALLHFCSHSNRPATT